MLDDNVRHLAIVDADKIHDYVFSPHELKLIRGGSAIQSQLCLKLIPALANSGDVIFNGGGTVLAKFRSRGLALDFCRQAEETFFKETSIATATTAVAPYPNGGFKAANEAVRELLERKKESRPGHQFSGSSPYAAICESCGAYPAGYRRSVEGGRSKLLCVGCQIRRNGSKRHTFYPPGVTPPADLGAIGEASRPQNYIALLYLDVDRLGKYLSDHAGNSEDDFHCLSVAIDSAVQSAVKDSCTAMFPGGQAVYEILLMGGDDAILAVPAQYGLPFLLRFQKSYCEAFARAIPADKHGAWRVPPVSAGVVIAHSHFPIKDFLRHASELLVSAKTVEGQHAVDYAIMSASMTGSILFEREQIAGQGGSYARTRKPYALPAFSALMEDVKKLKHEVPASKLKALYGIAYENVDQASLDYWYLLDHLEDEAAEELRGVVGRELWTADATNAADIAELLEFVP